ncbi:MAG: DnaA/Hda family protein [Rickettsiaceae bacterium]|nr:DnaA/Hda family protein [Rickettsiaceae bacterium]
MNIKFNESKQEILEIKPDPGYQIEDFVCSSSNLEAFNAISSKIVGHLPYKNILYVSGPKSSGKTFLTKIYAHIKNAKHVTTQNDIDALHKNYVIDDADLMREEDIFHIFNKCVSLNYDLLISAKSNWAIALPDLRSRINSVKQTFILPPDDEMIEAFIIAEFSRRSLSASMEVVNYLKPRVERNFDKIIQQINIIDQYCLTDKRNLSVKTLSSLMKAITLQ